MAHLRYPEDLFKVQREVYARYHVTDPQVFYTSQDALAGADRPDAPSAGRRRTAAVLPDPADARARREPRFSLTTTFAPVNRETLAAFMAVNSDADRPGVRHASGRSRCPATPRSPGRARCRTRSSRTRTWPTQLLALRRGGSAEVELGNLLTLPVAGGLMYVEPVYARATEGASYPTLRKVIVSFGDAGRHR